MNRLDFAKCMAFLVAGIGKELSAEEMETYFHCLEDLPLEVLQLAVKIVLIRHPWNTMPKPAEIRNAAMEVTRGERLPSAKAWELAWKACCRIDLEIEGSLQRHTENLPPEVLQAMRAVGISNLVGSKSQVSYLQDRFIKVYDQFAERQIRQEAMPLDWVREIEKHRPMLAGKIREIGLEEKTA